MAVLQFDKFIKQLEVKKVLIVGAGVTGRPAAKLFRDAGYNVYVLDEKPLSSEIKKDLSAISLLEDFKVTNDSIKKLLGFHFSFVLISPGISPRSNLGRALGELNIPLFTELDVAFPFIGMPSVAVTGTNGKTTVVHLIEQMFKQDAKDAELVGNVGLSFISKLSVSDLQEENLPLKEKAKNWIAELSSYQLEGVTYIKPKVSVLLNIDDDHLERHGNLSAYVAAKSRIFIWQDLDCWSIINKDEFWAEDMSGLAKGRVFVFGKVKNIEDVVNKNGCFYVSELNQIIFSLNGVVENYSLEKTMLVGIHNKLNLAASVAAARLSGVSARSVQKIVDDFKPLEHRVELVRVVKGVSYINDSKGTNVSAVVVALDMVEKEFSKGKVILMVGGKIKEGSWQGIRKRINERVRAVISFGGDRELILDRLELKQSQSTDSLIVKCIESMEYATYEAQMLASPGDVVLLSPGCASFDAFKDYIDRGEHFKKYVNSL